MTLNLMRQVYAFWNGLLAQMFSYFELGEIFLISRSVIFKPQSALISQSIGRKNSGSSFSASLSAAFYYTLRSVDFTFCSNASVEFSKAYLLLRQSFSWLGEIPLMPTTGGFYQTFLPLSEGLFSLTYFFSSFYFSATFLTVFCVSYGFSSYCTLSSPFYLSAFFNFYSCFCFASDFSLNCYFFSYQNYGQISSQSSSQNAMIQLISKNSFPFYNSSLPSTL